MNPYGEVREWFSYVSLCVPDFPAEDGVDLESAFARLFGLISKARSITKNPDKLRWIDIAIRESEEALAFFKSGKDDEGLKALQSALWRFDNVTQGKKHVVNFIVGADGTATPTGQDEGGIAPG